jgi:hypothetical protein
MRMKGFSESLYREITLRLTYATAELMETVSNTSAYNFKIRHVVFCALNTDWLRSEMSASEPLVSCFAVSFFFVKYLIDET